MALSKDVVIRLLGDAKSAQAAIKASADAADVSVSQYRAAERELAKQAAAEESVHKARAESMKKTSDSAMLMGGVVLAGFGYAVKASADFEKAMSGVSAATMAGADDMGRLRDAALKAGADTMYSATEAANAETELAKAGMSTADIVGGALTGALNLAAAGQLDVASAAAITATALQQYHLGGDQATHVSDLLAAGAGKAMGSVTDLSEALKYVGPVAHGMGVSIDETTGVLALFASNGILGTQAGTSLRGMISALTSPSKLAGEEMMALGLSVFDAQGNFVGLDNVAGALQKSLGGMTEAQRSAALGTIFGNEQLTAARVLYDAGKQGVDEWTSKVNDSGYAAEVAAKQTDNLSGDVERLGGSLSTVLIKGGTGGGEALRFMAQGATNLVNAIGDLPTPLLAVAAGFLGIVGGGTAMLGVVGTIVPRVREARNALESLGPTGERVNGALGKIGKAAGVVGAGLVVFTVLDSVMSALDPDIKTTTANIDQLTISLSEFGKFGTVGGELQKTFGDAHNAVQTLINDMNASRPVSEKMQNFWESFPKWMRDAALGAGLGSEAMDKATAGFAQAQQSISDVDKALSQMVGGGHADEAVAAANRLFEAWVASGGSAENFRAKFPGLMTALDNYKQASTTTVSQTGEITNGLGQAVTAADALKAAFDSLNGVALSDAEAHIKWTETLTGIKVAAEDGAKSLDLNTKAGADNGAQFVQAAKDASAYSQTVADTQGIEAGRAALQKMKDDLYNAAVGAGFNKDQVRKMIDTIFQVPKDTPTAVDLHDNATPGLNNVNNFLDRLNGKTAHTYVENTIATTYLNRVLNAQPIGIGGSGGNPIGLPPVRAAGGPVWPGTFLVGEHGPELLQMGGTGFITPANLTSQVLGVLGGGRMPMSSPVAMGGGGGGVDLNQLGDIIARAMPRTTGGVQVNVDHWDSSQQGPTPYETAEALAFYARGR